MRLFLYGTLLDPDRLAFYAGRALLLTPAQLCGWRRVALPDHRYPTLKRGRGIVEGALATVDRATLARLAAYEGPSYRLTRVVVRTTQRTLSARAWVAPGGTTRDWPLHTPGGTRESQQPGSMNAATGRGLLHRGSKEMAPRPYGAARDNRAARKSART